MLIKTPKFSVSKHKRAIAIIIGLMALLWFLALSELLLVKPGSIMTMRQNVLFHSDTSLSIHLLTDEKFPAQPSFQYFVHSLEFFLWRPVCRTLYHLLGIFLPIDYSRVLAGRLLVATIAGIGVGSLALFAFSNGVKLVQCVLLFIMYMMFTANTIVTLPEHFGLSNGLLSVAFVVPLIAQDTRLRMATYVGITALIGGTTITNALFPLASLANLSFKSIRAKICMSVVAILGLVATTLILAKMSHSINWFVQTFLNIRLLHDPAQAGTYAILSMVYPAIGPPPYLRPDSMMISYKPFSIIQYSWIQVIGVIAWITLISRSVLIGLQDDRTRSSVWLLLSWLFFNAVFHNIWGDEIFLYSPHWSWALMALIILGARDFSLRFVATMIIPLIIGQIHTLYTIRSALQSINSLRENVY